MALRARGILPPIYRTGQLRSIEYRGGAQRAAFDYIDERIRANTRLVLEDARKSQCLPRAAALKLAEQRVHTATLTRRWR
jgi:glutamate dehydrogenase (NAD(P)+)